MKIINEFESDNGKVFVFEDGLSVFCNADTVGFMGGHPSTVDYYYDQRGYGCKSPREVAIKYHDNFSASRNAMSLGKMTSKKKAASSAANGKLGGRPKLAEVVYTSVLYLDRDKYANDSEYRSAYRDCCKHYSFKSRVGGGWKFFEFQSDYDTWKNQR